MQEDQEILPPEIPEIPDIINDLPPAQLED